MLPRFTRKPWLDAWRSSNPPIAAGNPLTRSCYCSLFPCAAAARADERDVLHARPVEAQDFLLKDGDAHVDARLSVEAGG